MISSVAEEPMVCMTRRWREIDSNFPYAGAMNLVFAPFVSLDDRQLSKDYDGVARAVGSRAISAAKRSTVPSV